VQYIEPSGISDEEWRNAMAGLSDFEKMLPAPWRGKIRELDEDFPGIDTRPDVCGGEPCILRTRIPVWVIDQARRLGASEYALLAVYPNRRAEDLVNAWAYARAHAEEIEVGRSNRLSADQVWPARYDLGTRFYRSGNILVCRNSKTCLPEWRLLFPHSPFSAR
jgi:uncharacterized protein (DUF433 family)